MDSPNSIISSGAVNYVSDTSSVASIHSVSPGLPEPDEPPPPEYANLAESVADVLAVSSNADAWQVLFGATLRVLDDLPHAAADPTFLRVLRPALCVDVAGGVVDPDLMSPLHILDSVSAVSCAQLAGACILAALIHGAAADDPEQCLQCLEVALSITQRCCPSGEWARALFFSMQADQAWQDFTQTLWVSMFAHDPHPLQSLLHRCPSLPAATRSRLWTTCRMLLCYASVGMSEDGSALDSMLRERLVNVITQPVSQRLQVAADMVARIWNLLVRAMDEQSARDITVARLVQLAAMEEILACAMSNVAATEHVYNLWFAISLRCIGSSVFILRIQGAREIQKLASISLQNDKREEMWLTSHRFKQLMHAHDIWGALFGSAVHMEAFKAMASAVYMCQTLDDALPSYAIATLLVCMLQFAHGEECAQVQDIVAQLIGGDMRPLAHVPNARIASTARCFAALDRARCALDVIQALLKASKHMLAWPAVLPATLAGQEPRAGPLARQVVRQTGPRVQAGRSLPVAAGLAPHHQFVVDSSVQECARDDSSGAVVLPKLSLYDRSTGKPNRHICELLEKLTETLDRVQGHVGAMAQDTPGVAELVSELASCMQALINTVATLHLQAGIAGGSRLCSPSAGAEPLIASASSALPVWLGLAMWGLVGAQARHLQALAVGPSATTQKLLKAACRLHDSPAGHSAGLAGVGASIRRWAHAWLLGLVQLAEADLQPAQCIALLEAALPVLCLPERMLQHENVVLVLEAGAIAACELAGRVATSPGTTSSAALACAWHALQFWAAVAVLRRWTSADQLVGAAQALQNIAPAAGAASAAVLDMLRMCCTRLLPGTAISPGVFCSRHVRSIAALVPSWSMTTALQLQPTLRGLASSEPCLAASACELLAWVHCWIQRHLLPDVTEPSARPGAAEMPSKATTAMSPASPLSPQPGDKRPRVEHGSVAHNIDEDDADDVELQQGLARVQASPALEAAAAAPPHPDCPFMLRSGLFGTSNLLRSLCLRVDPGVSLEPLAVMLRVVIAHALHAQSRAVQQLACRMWADICHLPNSAVASLDSEDVDLAVPPCLLPGAALAALCAATLRDAEFTAPSSLASLLPAGSMPWTVLHVADALPVQDLLAHVCKPWPQSDAGSSCVPPLPAALSVLAMLVASTEWLAYMPVGVPARRAVRSLRETQQQVQAWPSPGSRQRPVVPALLHSARGDVLVRIRLCKPTASRTGIGKVEQVAVVWAAVPRHDTVRSLVWRAQAAAGFAMHSQSCKVHIMAPGVQAVSYIEKGTAKLADLPVAPGVELVRTSAAALLAYGATVQDDTSIALHGDPLPHALTLDTLVSDFLALQGHDVPEHALLAVCVRVLLSKRRAAEAADGCLPVELQPPAPVQADADEEGVATDLPPASLPVPDSPTVQLHSWLRDLLNHPDSGMPQLWKQQAHAHYTDAAAAAAAAAAAPLADCTDLCSERRATQQAWESWHQYLGQPAPATVFDPFPTSIKQSYAMALVNLRAVMTVTTSLQSTQLRSEALAIVGRWAIQSYVPNAGSPAQPGLSTAQLCQYLQLHTWRTEAGLVAQCLDPAWWAANPTVDTITAKVTMGLLQPQLDSAAAAPASPDEQPCQPAVTYQLRDAILSALLNVAPANGNAVVGDKRKRQDTTAPGCVLLCSQADYMSLLCAAMCPSTLLQDVMGMASPTNTVPAALDTMPFQDMDWQRRLWAAAVNADHPALPTQYAVQLAHMLLQLQLHAHGPQFLTRLDSAESALALALAPAEHPGAAMRAVAVQLFEQHAAAGFSEAQLTSMVHVILDYAARILRETCTQGHLSSLEPAPAAHSPTQLVPQLFGALTRSAAAWPGDTDDFQACSWPKWRDSWDALMNCCGALQPAALASAGSTIPDTIAQVMCAFLVAGIAAHDGALCVETGAAIADGSPAASEPADGASPAQRSLSEATDLVPVTAPAAFPDSQAMLAQALDLLCDLAQSNPASVAALPCAAQLARCLHSHLILRPGSLPRLVARLPMPEQWLTLMRALSKPAGQPDATGSWMCAPLLQALATAAPSAPSVHASSAGLLPDAQAALAELLSQAKAAASLDAADTQANAATHLAPYRGLVNQGNTCYMNAVLQQVIMLPWLRTALLRATGQPCTTDEYLDQLRELREQVLLLLGNAVAGPRNMAYNPLPFVMACRSTGSGWFPLESDVLEQNDSSEFLALLADRVDRAFPREGPVPAIMDAAIGGACVNQIQAVQGEYFSQRIEPFNVLSLGIEGHSELSSALTGHCAEEVLAGDNAYQLPSGEKVAVRKRVLLCRLPDTLVIQLKRFTLNFDTFMKEKVGTLCQFPEQLDVWDWTATAQNNAQGLAYPPSCPVDQVPDEWRTQEREAPGPQVLPGLLPTCKGDCEYRLQGVLVHAGSAYGGHYYSFIRARPEDEQVGMARDPSTAAMLGPDAQPGQWYQFNDDMVTPASAGFLQERCFGSARSSFVACAMLLCYDRVPRAAPGGAPLLSPAHLSTAPMPARWKGQTSVLLPKPILLRVANEHRQHACLLRAEGRAALCEELLAAHKAGAPAAVLGPLVRAALCQWLLIELAPGGAPQSRMSANSAGTWLTAHKHHVCLAALTQCALSSSSGTCEHFLLLFAEALLSPCASLTHGAVTTGVPAIQVLLCSQMAGARAPSLRAVLLCVAAFCTLVASTAKPASVPACQAVVDCAMAMLTEHVSACVGVATALHRLQVLVVAVSSVLLHNAAACRAWIAAGGVRVLTTAWISLGQYARCPPLAKRLYQLLAPAPRIVVQPAAPMAASSTGGFSVAHIGPVPAPAPAPAPASAVPVMPGAAPPSELDAVAGAARNAPAVEAEPAPSPSTPSDQASPSADIAATSDAAPQLTAWLSHAQSLVRPAGFGHAWAPARALQATVQPSGLDPVATQAEQQSLVQAALQAAQDMLRPGQSTPPAQLLSTLLQAALPGSGVQAMQAALLKPIFLSGLPLATVHFPDVLQHDGAVPDASMAELQEALGEAKLPPLAAALHAQADQLTVVYECLVECLSSLMQECQLPALADLSRHVNFSMLLPAPARADTRGSDLVADPSAAALIAVLCSPACIADACQLPNLGALLCKQLAQCGAAGSLVAAAMVMDCLRPADVVRLHDLQECMRQIVRGGPSGATILLHASRLPAPAVAGTQSAPAAAARFLCDWVLTRTLFSVAEVLRLGQVRSLAEGSTAAELADECQQRREQLWGYATKAWSALTQRPCGDVSVPDIAQVGVLAPPLSVAALLGLAAVGRTSLRPASLAAQGIANFSMPNSAKDVTSQLALAQRCAFVFMNSEVLRVPAMSCDWVRATAQHASAWTSFCQSMAGLSVAIEQFTTRQFGPVLPMWVAPGKGWAEVAQALPASSRRSTRWNDVLDPKRMAEVRAVLEPVAMFAVDALRLVQMWALVHAAVHACAAGAEAWAQNRAYWRWAYVRGFMALRWARMVTAWRNTQTAWPALPSGLIGVDSSLADMFALLDTLELEHAAAQVMDWLAVEFPQDTVACTATYGVCHALARAGIAGYSVTDAAPKGSPEPTEAATATTPALSPSVATGTDTAAATATATAAPGVHTDTAVNSTGTSPTNSAASDAAMGPLHVCVSVLQRHSDRVAECSDEREHPDGLLPPSAPQLAAEQHRVVATLAQHLAQRVPVRDHAVVGHVQLLQALAQQPTAAFSVMRSILPALESRGAAASPDDIAVVAARTLCSMDQDSYARLYAAALGVSLASEAVLPGCAAAAQRAGWRASTAEALRATPTDVPSHALLGSWYACSVAYHGEPMRASTLASLCWGVDWSGGQICSWPDMQQVSAHMPERCELVPAWVGVDEARATAEQLLAWEQAAIAGPGLWHAALPEVAELPAAPARLLYELGWPAPAATEVEAPPASVAPSILASLPTPSNSELQQKQQPLAPHTPPSAQAENTGTSALSAYYNWSLPPAADVPGEEDGEVRPGNAL